MMEEDDEQYTDFDINYDNVIASKECLSMTRILAADLKANPYMTVGDFLMNISKSDLAILSDIVEQHMGFDEDDEVTDERMADFVLMTEMLSRAEGLISEDDDDLTRKINQFMIMVTMENLYRKGLIKLYHENMSFGKDVEHRIVAEKIKGAGDED
jgi:hypothetical protein